MKVALSKFSRRQLVLGATALILLVGGTAVVRAKRSNSHAVWKEDSSSEPLTAAVTTGPFTQEVIERGEVQSSRNVEVRCQVPTRGTQGLAIIQIVPEGTIVKAGDF